MCSSDLETCDSIAFSSRLCRRPQESGRFKTNEKICLSISGHHAETWTPTWGVRTALLAIIGFMETPGEGALGSLDYTPEERKILAKR